MKNANFSTLLFLAALLLAPSANAVEPSIDNDNDDSSALVFVSGLGGAETWEPVLAIMAGDDSLTRFDAYVFDSVATKKSILGASKELNRFLGSDRLSDYGEIKIVAHSIGGIITKDYLLNRLGSSSPSELREKYVLFIGTPHIKNEFTAPPLKKFFSFIFYFTLSDLAKDALNSTDIKQINQRWIDEVESNEDRYIKNLALFGNDDEVVEPENLSNIFVGQYLVIEGTHLGIAQASGESGCTYQIFRRKVIDPDSDVDDLGCSVY